MPKAEVKEPTVAERVTTIIAEHLGCDLDKAVATAKLVDDLGADSLDHVELVMAFEEEFRIEITDEESERCLLEKTVGDWVTFLTKKAETPTRS